jgi:hypothetical protein
LRPSAAVVVAEAAVVVLPVARVSVVAVAGVVRAVLRNI